MTDATAAARTLLARAREDLAAAHRAQDPERHFRGLPESPEVIAAYDAVREAERRVVEAERDGAPSGSAAGLGSP